MNNYMNNEFYLTFLCSLIQSLKNILQFLSQLLSILQKQRTKLSVAWDLVESCLEI